MKEVITGRLEPEIWDEDDTTVPRLDALTLHDERRARFDHEFGAPLENVPPIGAVS